MEEHLKILVVDDEQCIRDIFKNYLAATTNYTVLTANDGLEALDTVSYTHLTLPTN